jgi:Mrp family chromosome partitioning ATPase
MNGKFHIFGGIASRKRDPNVLSRKEREAVRRTQQPWIEMALNILNSRALPMPLAIGVTSAGHGEGKTTTTLGLASALARESQNRILLIECDVERASLAQKLKLERPPGLTDYITSGGRIDDFVVRTRIPNLDVLVAIGTEQDKGYDEGLWNDNMLSRLRRYIPNMLANFKEEYPHIILEMPTFLSSPYANELFSVLDGVLVSARAGVTSQHSLRQVSDKLGEGKLLGLILTGGETPLPDWLVRLLKE